MIYVYKETYSHGMNNPIIARLGKQTRSILDFFKIEQSKTDEIFDVYHKKVTASLLECFDIKEYVVKETESICAKIDSGEITVQSLGRCVNLPQVDSLETKSKEFLYAAKNSLRDIALIFEPLFGKKFDGADFSKIRKWASVELGSEVPVTQLISADELWIKKIVDMRNAVEHPKKTNCLNINNFDLLEDKENGRYEILKPRWHLNGMEPVSICDDMVAVTENILELAEELLVHFYMQLHPDSIVQFVVIPENRRSRECPIRYKAEIDESKTINPS